MKRALLKQQQDTLLRKAEEIMIYMSVFPITGSSNAKL
jgi:hypothetical protein